MELYSGAKTIKARPMKEADYRVYSKKASLLSDEPDREGYLVGYPDSDGKFVGELEGECNYISWSPIAEFDNAYYKGDIGNASDGYHTFNELYEYRKMYNALLFKEWAIEEKFGVHKSTRHSDGELCFGGGYFIVMAQLPTGQISNHYPMKDWDLFDIPCRCLINKWDGHTPQDVLTRMADNLIQYVDTYPAPDFCCAMCGKVIDESIPEIIIQAGTALVFCSTECETKS